VIDNAVLGCKDAESLIARQRSNIAPAPSPSSAGSPSLAPVPEPGTLGLLAVGALFGWFT